mmetsp:Transcript_17816/g.23972  ORF Transcript_17816/g.23972 Transcript_17816/m.23972 type:complete len:126 (+) Transcript_17816:635-1012(+)
MSEEQFIQLEAFCRDQMRKLAKESYMKEDANDTVSIKSLTKSLGEKLRVFDEINNLLFKPERPAKESLNAINFFNSVKRVLIRSGGPEKRLNLRIFAGLLHELRIKLDIAKAGLAPAKIMHQIDS